MKTWALKKELKVNVSTRNELVKPPSISIDFLITLHNCRKNEILENQSIFQSC